MSKQKCYKGKQTLFENRISEIKSFWTIDDLIRETGLAKQTIYNNCQKGLIPYRKRWGKLYFVPDEIINLIEEGGTNEF